MAIAFDELIGRAPKQEFNEVKQFPSYEEFKSRNSASKSSSLNDYFAKQETISSATAQSVNYTQSTSYQTPKTSEFVGNYDRFDENMNYIKADSYQDAVAVDKEMTPGSLYEFCQKDYDRKSSEELFEKLAHTQDKTKSGIVFSDAAQAPTRLRFSERRALKQEGQVASKVRSKLNVKGKIILGVYVAVVLVSAILIIVNAKKINNGENLVPSGSFEDFSYSQDLNA